MAILYEYYIKIYELLSSQINHRIGVSACKFHTNFCPTNALGTYP